MVQIKIKKYYFILNSFTNLYSDEVASAFLSYLYKGVTGHVLYSLMHFVHELKQLVYNRLQELPMLAQEPRGEITVSL